MAIVLFAAASCRPVEGVGREEGEGNPVDRKDRSYFAKRAEEELKAADAAGDPRAANAHSMLAGWYLDLAHNGEARPPRNPPDET